MTFVSNDLEIRTKNFIKLSKKKFGENKFDYSKINYKGMKHDITLICNVHGEFTTNANYHYELRTGCMKCDREQRIQKNIPSLRENFIRKAKIRWGDKYSYDNCTDYQNNYTSCTITCNVHDLYFKILPSNFLYNTLTPCPICASLKQSSDQSKDTEHFIKLANKVHGDKYDYSRSVYRTRGDNILIRCKEHGEFVQRAGNHLNGTGCPICARISSYNSNFADDANKVHNYKYDYSKVVYLGNKKKVEIICKEHGSFWQKPNSHLNGAGCPYCSQSKVEKEISKWLKDNSIDFTIEHRLPGYLYRYDFYLTKLNILIEYHGEQHFKYDINNTYTQGSHLPLYIRDFKKIEIAKRNNIPLIIVDCYDYRKGILFDLLAKCIEYYSHQTNQ